MTGWKRLGASVDTGVGKGTERLGRFVSRRAALRTAVLTGATALGAVALGQRPAFAAVRCPAYCGPSSHCPKRICPEVGCPVGHHLCKVVNGHNPCPGLCEWPTGSWVHCVGYGKCGHGFSLCQDCKPDHGCAGFCICVSGVLCRECCSPADVRAEQRRVRDILAVS